MEILPGFGIPLLIVLVIFFGVRTRRKEMSEYNYGYCPECGERMELVGCDSLGRRKYSCHRCQYICRVSYRIDRFHNS